MTTKETFLNAIKGREIYYFDHEGQLKLNGYFYDAGGSCTDDPKQTWRHVELCWCYPDVAKLKEDKCAEIDRIETECKQYISDLTPEEVLQMFACYFKGAMPVPAILDADSVDRLAATKNDVAYIDTDKLPEFPYGECANNPEISVEIL